MAKINFRAALLAAIGISAIGKKESEQDFAVRVAEHISEKVDEDTYNALSKEATKWYEAAVKALEQEKPVPLLPEAEAAPEPTAKKAAAAAPVKKASPKKAAVEPEPEPEPEPASKKDAKKKAASKKAASKKAAAEEEGPRVSISDLVRVLVCKNPKLTKEQIRAKLDEAGHELADVQLVQMYRQAQRIITILTELGWAKQAKA